MYELGHWMPEYCTWFSALKKSVKRHVSKRDIYKTESVGDKDG